MINQPAFIDIENYSEIIENNEFFLQYVNEEIPNQFESNFILLKYSPTLPEFKIIEQLQKDYQLSKNYNHLKFYWPENTGIHLDVLDYLSDEAYKIGRQELMVIGPKDYHLETNNEEVQFEIVTEKSFDLFLELNHKEDLSINKDFANHRKNIYRYQLNQPHVKFILATIHSKPVASLILISSEHFLELDNVLTDTDFRNKGIASSMINFVMTKQNDHNKPIILVVDAEDTPKKLYQKLGFQIVSSQISAEKESF